MKNEKINSKKRVILPDSVFNEVMVTKFVNHLMYDGKKSISFDIFYTSLDLVKAKLPNEEKTLSKFGKTLSTTSLHKSK